MTLLDDVAGARGSGSDAATRAKNPVAEIAEALLEMGGSAHREAVIDRVAIRRGHMFVSDGLRLELLAAFDRHLATAARKGKPVLLHLPFGEGSRRWGLTREAMLSARSAEAPTSTVALLAVPASVTLDAAQA